MNLAVYHIHRLMKLLYELFFCNSEFWIQDITLFPCTNVISIALLSDNENFRPARVFVVHILVIVNNRRTMFGRKQGKKGTNCDQTLEPVKATLILSF